MLNASCSNIFKLLKCLKLIIKHTEYIETSTSMNLNQEVEYGGSI